jgi:uncharacterized protein
MGLYYYGRMATGIKVGSRRHIFTGNRKTAIIYGVEGEKMFFWDYTILLIIPPLLLALYAQHKVKSTFDAYSKKTARSGITGAEAARQILDTRGAGVVHIERVSGRLADHYDPRKKTLRLSEGVYGSKSLAALGVAAHEAGHALQHHAGYVPLHQIGRAHV